MTVFPKGKHDDQVDSTAQFLDRFKKPMPNWEILLSFSLPISLHARRSP
jgi:hypothetical protein